MILGGGGEIATVGTVVQIFSESKAIQQLLN